MSSRGAGRGRSSDDLRTLEQENKDRRKKRGTYKLGLPSSLGDGQPGLIEPQEPPEKLHG